jgi:hypothetical protein
MLLPTSELTRGAWARGEAKCQRPHLPLTLETK